MSEQHTEGPWVSVTQWDDGTAEYHATQIEGSRPVGGLCPILGRTRGHVESFLSVEEDRANGRLMAAAPELLDALRDLLAWARMDHSTHPQTMAVREKCEAAIAKATGND